MVDLPENMWIDCVAGASHRGPVTVPRSVAWDAAAVFRRLGGDPGRAGVVVDVPAVGGDLRGGAS